MRALASVLFFLITLHLAAQRECATLDYTKQQAGTAKQVQQDISFIDDFIQQNTPLSSSGFTTGRMTTATIIYIPVVVHVLYNNPTQNISDEQIKSQVAALNRDFRKRNEDTANTPDRFKPFAADVEIEFVLATADPVGKATKGIIRKSTRVSDWNMDDKIKFSAQGGDDAWDSKSYLNIWVGSMRRLLGYSSIPGGQAERDGIVINTSAFGTLNTAPPYHLGRTAVHEAGHWLGLKHIWGEAMCGDDLVEDTPKQGGFTSGCPTTFRTSCSNALVGDMYMNYMDFTADACINLFTAGQKQRMRILFSNGGSRAALLSSKGLNEPWTKEVVSPEKEIVKTPVITSSSLYPNPATDKIVLTVDQSWIGKPVTIIGMRGERIQTIIITSKQQQITLSNLKGGIYCVQGENTGEKLNEKFVKL